MLVNHSFSLAPASGARDIVTVHNCRMPSRHLGGRLLVAFVRKIAPPRRSYFSAKEHRAPASSI